MGKLGIILALALVHIQVFAKDPRNLQQSILKNNSAFVQRFLEVESPDQVQWNGFGQHYFELALENVRKYRNDSGKLADANRIVDLMRQADIDRSARTHALYQVVYRSQFREYEQYRHARELVEMGADINYFVCVDYGFGLGKKSPSTILDYTIQGMHRPENARFSVSMMTYLKERGGKFGNEIKNNCDL